METRIREAAAARGEDVNQFATTILAKAVAQQENSLFRGKPLAQFMSEMREKHNLPPDWGTGNTPLSDADWQTMNALYDYR